jgi:hypothetical protein
MLVSSTYIEEPPGLLEYHTRLLKKCGSPNDKPPLNLDFIVYENWVMLQVGEIAALDV